MVPPWLGTPVPPLPRLLPRSAPSSVLLSPPLAARSLPLPPPVSDPGLSDAEPPLLPASTSPLPSLPQANGKRAAAAHSTLRCSVSFVREIMMMSPLFPTHGEASQFPLVVSKWSLGSHHFNLQTQLSYLRRRLAIGKRHENASHARIFS